MKANCALACVGERTVPLHDGQIEVMRIVLRSETSLILTPKVEAELHRDALGKVTLLFQRNAI